MNSQMMSERPVTNSNSPRMATLALALLLLVSPSLAKQPSSRETGPRVYRCDVRYRQHRQYLLLPVVERWHDKGSHLEYAGHELPGCWEYVVPNPWDGLPPYFWRNTHGTEQLGDGTIVARRERMGLDEMARVGGLPW